MRRLSWSSPDDRAWLVALGGAPRIAPGLEVEARAIVDDVAVRGDAAVRDHVRRHGGDERVLLTPEAWERACEGCPQADRTAIRKDAEALRAFHRREWVREMRVGAWRRRVRPFDRVGLVAVGDPSPWAVLALAVPAAVAGVGERVLVVPEPVDPAVAWAAREVGIHRILVGGGAPAVAALAVGTAAIPRVDAVVGMPDAGGAAAMRCVADRIAIEVLGGWFGVAVVADDAADSDRIARVLGRRGGVGVVVTPSPALAEAVAVASHGREGVVVVVADLAEAAEVVDAVAPGRLWLAVSDPEKVLSRVRRVGTVGIGTVPPGAGLGPPVHRFVRSIDVFDAGGAADRDPARFARAAVRRQILYSLEGAPPDAEVKINQNEAPEDVPPEVKEEVFRRLRSAAWHKYPDMDAASLRERLAALWGWTPEGVILGNGSNDLLSLLYRVVVRPGDRVVVPRPCFSMYPLHLDLQDAVVDPVAITREGFDAAALIDKALGARMVMVASPNNPTGTVLSPDVLDALLDAGSLVALDEAYAEWSGSLGLSRLSEDAPLVVLRTFSKAWGVAGVRFGALLGPPRLVEELRKARLPFGVGILARTVAEVLLDRPELLRTRLRETSAERDRLWAALADRGLDPWPTAANFILWSTRGRDPRALLAAMLDQGVLVRDVSKAVPGHLRVSVGSAAQNDRFLAALDAALEAG